jgi:hypothetical protein
MPKIKAVRRVAAGNPGAQIPRLNQLMMTIDTYPKFLSPNLHKFPLAIEGS